MWKCHKCGKPVYFAERKLSLGYNWHPECLRCEECGKRLNPGQHAEHKGVPYCHVPCYGALFGPQLFGHGTRVESHKSFGQQPKDGTPRPLPRTQLETKLRAYNQFFEGRSGEIRSREVNGRLILEGSLRIHWGVQGVIHLKENDDQRTVVTVRKRNSCVGTSASPSDDESADEAEVTPNGTQLDCVDADENGGEVPRATPECLPKSITLPSKLDVKNMEWDELDELLQVERRMDDGDKLYRTMPDALPSHNNIDSTDTSISSTLSCQSSSMDESRDSSTLEASTPTPSTPNGNTDDDVEDLSPLHRPIASSQNWMMANGNHLNRSMSGPDSLCHRRSSLTDDEDTTSLDLTTMSDVLDSTAVVIRRPPRTGASAIRRRPGRRLSRSKVKRRCSINGHFYDRETSFFTPPHGSQMSVWITSLVNTHEVINLILEKYKVESDSNHFALFVVRDNGEQRRLREDEYPLLVRVMLGPHEDVAKLFLMDSHTTPEVSSEVAQFLNLSLAECRAILNQYYSQEEREVAKIKDKYTETKRRMLLKMEELKAGL